MTSQKNTEDNNTKSFKELDFETALAELEKIVQSLEQGDLTLEESMTKFQQGIELSKICNNKLQQAEEKIEQLTKDSETGEMKLQQINIEEE